MVKTLKKEIEACPKCGSIYIQYDGVRDEFYCLVNICLNRWKGEIKGIDSIQNIYLKASMWKYKKLSKNRK